MQEGDPSAAEGEAREHDVPAIVQPLAIALREGRDPVPSVEAAARMLGFHGFSFVVLRHDMDGSVRSSFVLTSLAPAYIAECSQGRVLSYDPRVRAASLSVIPVVWDRHRLPDDDQAHEFLAIANRYDVRSGVFYQVRQPDPSCTVWFSLTSDADRIEQSPAWPVQPRMGEIMALAGYLFHLGADAIFAVHGPDERVGTLTVRERQCLQQVATGSTSRTAAIHLGISERTVNAHLEQAIRKLGASNRQQAVAQAVRRGIIRL
ncbi:MAG: LuxR C-terminal-related transcriptional regulator [Burkholderiales bacterium]